MRLRNLLLAASMLVGCAASLQAQKVALKTNLLYDAFATPSLGIEVGLAPKWTLDISGQVCAWDVNKHKWKQWVAQPEARYWFCRTFSGHFLGIHALGGQYNFGNLDLPFKFLNTNYRELKDKRWQGWMVGAGIAYGYAWILDKHWNLEAEIGIGWAYTRQDVYDCKECEHRVRKNRPHNYVGPTKAAINLVYTF